MWNKFVLVTGWFEILYVAFILLEECLDFCNFLKTRFFCKSCLCSILEHVWHVLIPLTFRIVFPSAFFLLFKNVSLTVKSLRQLSTYQHFHYVEKATHFWIHFSYMLDYILALMDFLLQTFFIHVNKLYAK